MQWQPIETAPEGIEILAHKCDEGFFLVTKIPDGRYRESFGGNKFSGGITHWMPLPTPPTT